MINFWDRLPKPIIALAPMAGYTDSAFRLICRQMGADVVYSEMMSVDAICYQNKKTLDMLRFNRAECPLVLQLFGNKPRKFSQAIDLIYKQIKNKKLFKPDEPSGSGLSPDPLGNNSRPEESLPIGIDINFGCPAHKVFKNGSGAALMDQIDRAYEIITAVSTKSEFPISIKIRTKVRNTTAIEFINKIKKLDFKAVMIHGRSLKQGFNGEIDLKMIKKIKQIIPDKIVLANGGIDSAEKSKNIMDKTKADGIGIGRESWGNPWIFESLKHVDTKAFNHRNIDWGDKKKVILKQAELFLEYNDNLVPLRKHLVHYFKGQKNASLIRNRIIKVKTMDELKQVLAEVK